MDDSIGQSGSVGALAGPDTTLDHPGQDGARRCEILIGEPEAGGFGWTYVARCACPGQRGHLYRGRKANREEAAAEARFWMERAGCRAVPPIPAAARSPAPCSPPPE